MYTFHFSQEILIFWSSKTFELRYGNLRLTLHLPIKKKNDWPICYKFLNIGKCTKCTGHKTPEMTAEITKMTICDNLPTMSPDRQE